MSLATVDRLPPPVRRVLSQWLGDVLRILGDKVEGALVFGSVALGEFAPRWSDVDVALALARVPDAAEVRRLDALQRELRRRYVQDGEDGWASEQLVEGLAVPTALLARSEGRGEGLEVDTDGVRALAEVAIEPFDRLLLARHAVPLLATPCLVAPPSDAALRAQLRRDLDRLELKRDPTPVWQVGMLHWGARSLRHWRDGVVASKGEALDREIRRGGPLEEAFRFAARCREEGAAVARARADEARRLFDDARPRLLEALAPYA